MVLGNAKYNNGETAEEDKKGSNASRTNGKEGEEDWTRSARNTDARI